jgi:hypothetical protein
MLGKKLGRHEPKNILINLFERNKQPLKNMFNGADFIET